MHRFFAGRLDDRRAELLPEEVPHALRVLRLQAGDAAELLMEGEKWSAEICSIEGQRVICRLQGRLPSAEPGVEVTLFQGLPKAEKMEWVIQKATELGAARICAVAMERSVAKIGGREADKKRERWQKIACEAVKQSGRCRVPEVRICTLSEAAEMARDLDLFLVPWEEESGLRLSGALAKREKPQGRIGLLIGPEGGISKNEVELLRQAGALPVSLGRRILRTETAALAALAAVMALSGEM